MEAKAFTIPDADVGVIVGRFQVDDLHAGHFDLLKEVSDSHERMFVVIGLSAVLCTINNPLDFDTRRRMIMEYFPQAVILYIEDVHNDELWSTQLDEVIRRKLRKKETALLYGSRMSFIKYYTGKYPTRELEQTSIISGSEVRKQLALRSKATADFRAGAIWALNNQYNNPLPTVDIAVLKSIEGKTKILLGRKKNEKRYRLIGGFAETEDTYEATAVRELKEETNLVCDEFNLSAERSFFIDDWRYKNEVRKITTFLFTVDFDDCRGEPKPDDDIVEVKWFEFDGTLIDNIVPNHVQMVAFLVDKYYFKG